MAATEKSPQSFCCLGHAVIIVNDMPSGLASITDWLMGPEPLDQGPDSGALRLEELQLPGALSASGGPLHRLRPLWGTRCSHLWPRWLFLRALGLIYFSAFYSLLFQIKGLIGPDGILPARDYLEAVLKYYGSYRYWFAPTLLWFSSSNPTLMLICAVGLAASILLILNLWPRGMLAVCFVAYLSFVGAGQDFAGYQSDGMLLSAGFISIFFASPGFLLAPGPRQRAIACQPVFAATRVVLHLLRIGLGKNDVRRAGLAELHGDGQLLSEWTAAHVDRVVRSAAPALVSRRNGRDHPRCGACDHMDVIFAAAPAHHLFLDRHAI